MNFNWKNSRAKIKFYRKARKVYRKARKDFKKETADTQIKI